MIINNFRFKNFDFVICILVSHFYHEPLAREIGQPLPVYLTVNKLYLKLYVGLVIARMVIVCIILIDDRTIACFLANTLTTLCFFQCHI